MCACRPYVVVMYSIPLLEIITTTTTTSHHCFSPHHINTSSTGHTEHQLLWILTNKSYPLILAAFYSIYYRYYETKIYPTLNTLHPMLTSPATTSTAHTSLIASPTDDPRRLDGCSIDLPHHSTATQSLSPNVDSMSS